MGLAWLGACSSAAVVEPAAPQPKRVGVTAEPLGEAASIAADFETKKEPYCRWSGKRVNLQSVREADAALRLGSERRRAALSEHLPWGVPSPPAAADNQTLLVSEHFVILYDADLFAPVWTAHTLTAEDLNHRLSRHAAFRSDPRLPPAVGASCRDYREPVFDQGHMVPNSDMQRSLRAMLNTYTLSNMTPQHCSTNRGVWMALEQAIRHWAKLKGHVTVFTGALYDWRAPAGQDPDSQIPRLKPDQGEARVGIPSHLFKIVLRSRADESIESLAIMIPNSTARVPVAQVENYLQEHLVSIDMLERLTGFRFLPELAQRAPEVEAPVSRFRASRLWPHPPVRGLLDGRCREGVSR